MTTKEILITLHKNRNGFAALVRIVCDYSQCKLDENTDGAATCKTVFMERLLDYVPNLSWDARNNFFNYLYGA